MRIATDAHDGQLDKSGKPYIGHPVRVMNRVSGDQERMAAVLHDVIEDTPVTAEDLRAAGCPDRAVTAVVALRHLPDEPQADYLARVAADPIAVVVKRADIADNLSPARFSALDEAGGAGDMSVRIVPDSGTGELTGISGTLRIDKRDDGTHSYQLDYEV